MAGHQTHHNSSPVPKSHIVFALKLPILNQCSNSSVIDYDEIYRILTVHGTPHLYQECIKSGK